LTLSDNTNRIQFCEQAFGVNTSNSNSCVDNFCDMCCSMNSKQPLTCKNGCEAEYKPMVLDELAMQTCLDQKDRESDSVHLQQCKQCCATFDFHKYAENSLTECNK